MKNRLFYAEFGDADAAPAAAAEENSRKKVSDAFRVSFDNSQKKFFGLVRDGIFALLALVLFALSFAPVYGVRSSAYSPEYTTVDIIGMMFDLTADWDDEKYYEEYRDASEEFSEKYDEARKAGNYAEMRRLADRWRIEETRLLLRLERTDIPIGTFVVGGLIGLFFIVFAFLLVAVYVTAFVRTLLGKDRIPAFLASRKLFAACGGCHGALFPAYLFYMVLFLLAVLQFGTITTYFVAGSMAAALAFASLGTLIFLADAFASSDRAAKKRIWSGITVFALSLTAVGVMFTPALTIRINDQRGTASSTLLRNLDFSDEDWADEARRYYIGIVGKFGAQTQALLKKASGLDISMICPLHGPVLSENIGYYVDLYNTWSSYTPEADGVVIAYTSVYGHTKAAVEKLASQLEEKGCKCVVYDLCRCDIAAAVADAFRYSKLVLATTTYNGGIFPAMREYIEHLTDRSFQRRTVGIIENGSWGPMAAKTVKAMLEPCKDVSILEPTVTIKCAVNQAVEAKISELCEAIAK